MVSSRDSGIEYSYPTGRNYVSKHDGVELAGTSTQTERTLKDRLLYFGLVLALFLVAVGGLVWVLFESLLLGVVPELAVQARSIR